MGIISNIEKSRKTRVVAGSISGIVFSIVAVLFSFILRTVFIRKIGVEYLGLYTFLSEMIGLLMAVDGGICSSLFIKIHKPIAQNDVKEMAETFRLIRIVYTLRAIVVLLVGVVLFIFLPYLADDIAIDIAIVKKAYIMYLLLNACSYLLIYYEFILEAFQKRYLTNLILFVVTTICTIINIACIYIYTNFFLYIIITALSHILAFAICDGIVRKKYNYLYSYDRSKEVDLTQFKDMLKITYYTLSTVLVKNTDNILVTKFLGFRISGLYSTYKMLNGQVFNLISKVKYSAQDSTRNYIASSDGDSPMILIERLTYVYFWIGGFCSICLVCLSTPFITLWLGSDYILPLTPIALTVLTLFVDTLLFPMDDAFYSTETYKSSKSIPVIEVIINLGISILLGFRYGISGIMIGTMSYLIYKAIVRSYYMYRKSFNRSNVRYLSKVLYYTTITIISFAVTYKCCSYFGGDTIATFVIRTAISGTVPVACFYLFTMKMSEYSYFKELVVVASKK